MSATRTPAHWGDRSTTPSSSPLTTRSSFDIPGSGAHTITPLVASLPILTQPVTLRGYVQLGSVQATSHSLAQATIEIDATPWGRGREIGGEGSEVRLGDPRSQDACCPYRAGTARLTGTYVPARWLPAEWAWTLARSRPPRRSLNP
jgi:hypothetical protein